jgi:hypothetical protein
VIKEANCVIKEATGELANWKLHPWTITASLGGPAFFQGTLEEGKFEQGQLNHDYLDSGCVSTHESISEVSQWSGLKKLQCSLGD